MQKLNSNHAETQSLNIGTQNLTRLQELFPEAFTEGRLDFEVLKQLLGNQIDDSKEKYGLNWNGKARARHHALTPTRATLRPDKGSSVDWDTTQNLMIEGDNLEVLKLLQRSYVSKVKLIYIDPPYNTGKDFVYPDNYTDSLKNYQELTGQLEEGRRISSNVENNGRFHTDWLNMMYPRIKLARELLRDDGAIFVSLDDSEAPNLRKMMDEVFGEENFVAIFPWRSRTAKADVPFGVSRDVEWITCYAKRDFLAGRTGERKYFKSDDYESRWRLADLTKQTTKDERPNSFFDMVNPKDGKPYPASPQRTWAITVDTFDKYYKDGRIVFPGDYNFLDISRPYFRVFEEDDKKKALKKYGTEEIRMAISTYLSEKTSGRSEHGSKEIRELFGSQVFSFPKPLSLIRYLIESTTNSDDIILDFFAGSGTTGHAVMAQNAADNSSRQFILVQLPEPVDPAKSEQKTAADFCDSLSIPRNIAELTKERLRRAGAKVKAENSDWQGDTGFRVFKLDSSNLASWDSDAARTDLEGTLQFAEDNIKAGRTETDVLYEVLLKLGLPLTTPIAGRTMAGLNVEMVGGGALVACLARTIPADKVQELGKGIADWLETENPAGEAHILFLDSAFENDTAKLNLSKYLAQRADQLKRNWVVRSL